MDSSGGSTTNTVHQCDICQEQYASKNKLFKHLQTHGIQDKQMNQTKVCLLVGWLSNYDKESKEDSWIKGCILDTKSVEEIDIVEEALWLAIDQVEGHDSDFIPGQRRKGFARCTSYASRASYLLSSEETSLVADLFCFQIRRNVNLSDAEWLKIVNTHLPDTIRVHQIQYLPSIAHDFHAETNCSQRVYEYLIPHAYIFNAVTSGVYTHSATNDDNEVKFVDNGANCEINILGGMQEVKKRHKRFENEVEDEIDKRVRKELKTIFHMFQNSKNYHNYVIGGSTPDEVVTHRKINKIHLKEVIEIDSEKYCVFSFSGDSFLRGQIRKIMGVVLAVLYKYLSVDYVRDTLSERIYNVPMWDGLSLYLDECRYSKFEAKFDGYAFNNIQNQSGSGTLKVKKNKNKNKNARVISSDHNDDPATIACAGELAAATAKWNGDIQVASDTEERKIARLSEKNTSKQPLSASLPPPGSFRLDPRRYSASYSQIHEKVIEDINCFKKRVQRHVVQQMERRQCVWHEQRGATGNTMALPQSKTNAFPSMMSAYAICRLQKLEEECAQLMQVRDELICLYNRKLEVPMPSTTVGIVGSPPADSSCHSDQNTNTLDIQFYMKLDAEVLKARVLALLRKADASGAWPASTLARQKIIEGSSTGSNPIWDVADTSVGSGSFSIGTYPPPLSSPKGNELFPGR